MSQALLRPAVTEFMANCTKCGKLIAWRDGKVCDDCARKHGICTNCGKKWDGAHTMSLTCDGLPRTMMD